MKLKYNIIINILLTILFITIMLKNLILITSNTIYFKDITLIYFIIYLVLISFTNYLYNNNIVKIKIKKN